MTDVLLTAAITLEGDWYVARCLQVEVASQGETSLELYFEDEPPPADVQPPIIAPLDISVRVAG